MPQKAAAADVYSLFYGETLAVLALSVKDGLSSGPLRQRYTGRAQAPRRRDRVGARLDSLAPSHYKGAMNTRNRYATLTLAFFCMGFMGVGAQGRGAERGDGLLLASTPIFYGEEAFTARIAARAGGGREALGLVLSGGSARAFAHIGVLRRLEEAGIVPDFIVANSMGSIIGLLYAAGLSPDQIYRLVSGTELGALFEPVLPARGGILDPRRFSDLIRLYLGELRLEDLPIPILVVCEDLVTKREIRLAEGDFTTVMEAAYALPVYFPPVPYGEHLLIDGGISNLVPLGTAREFTNSAIVSSTFYDAKNLSLRNPLVILNSSIDIGKRRAGVEDLLRYPDALWIRCAVESFSFMAFDRLAELDAEGYRSADAMAKSFSSLAGAAELSQSGAVERLAPLRAGLERSLAEAGRAWSPFERAPADQPALSIAPALRSHAYPGDTWLLNDEFYMGLGFGLRLAALELELAGGFSWDAYGGAAPAPGLYGGVEFYPMPWLKLDGMALASWPDGVSAPAETGAGRVALYQSAAVSAAFPKDSGRLELFSMLELSFADLVGAGASAFGADQLMLLSSGARVAIDSAGPLRGLTLAAGHQLAGAWDENLAFAELGLALAPLEALVLRSRAMARAALADEGLAPFFFSDPFSLADAAAVDGRGRAWLGASLSVGWEPERAALSFAELIILRRLSFALFADAAWIAGAAYPASSALGLRLGCDLSLIGLKSARLLFEAGTDPEGDKLFLRFFLAPAGQGR